MTSGDAGDSGMDIWAMDVARYGDYANLAYTNAKVQENYRRRFRITFPNEEKPAARPASRQPRSTIDSPRPTRSGARRSGSSMPLVPAEAKARQEAVEACKRSSKSCANGPASTNEMEDVFAVMCCTKPRRGCAVGVAGARQDALKSVQKTFADAGYSNCSLRSYLSAATGKKD